MSDELKELNTQLSKLTVDVQTKHEEMLKNRITPAEFKAFEEKVDKRWAEIDLEIAKLKVPSLGIENKKDEAAIQKKAFDSWLRRGALTPEEQKVLTIAPDTAGGYLAPDQFIAELLVPVKLFSPIRSLARVLQTTQKKVNIPKETASFAAAWGGEVTTVVESTGTTFGQEVFSPYEMVGLVKISKEMLEDSAFNMDSYIAAELGRQFGILEGTSFVVGTGSGQPEGFTVNAAAIALMRQTAGSNVIAPDDLVGLQYDLPSPYVPNATWVMRRSTVATIRTLKEATTNAYMWQPGLQLGQPPTLLGSPVVEAVDMPYGLVDNQYEVAYGDFRAGYMIVDRIGIEIQRLLELYAINNTIGFLARKRVDAHIVMAEAIRLLKIKA